MPRLNRPPKLGLHKASGQACVHWRGKRHYLGVYGSKQAAEAYARFLVTINELAEREEAVPSPPATGWITITELCAAYLQHAQGYYVNKAGEPTDQLDKVKRWIRILVDRFGTLAVNEFGPRRLKALQQSLVEDGLSRTGVNKRVCGIRRIFVWGESEELVPRGTAHTLGTVRGLRKGRSKARECKPIGPVDDQVVDDTIPKLPPIVGDMVALQRVTGMRPSEVCILRPADIDRSEAVWCYTPTEHKMGHLDKNRVVYLGPQAQAILAPYLLRAADSFCFSPAESEKRRLEERHAERVVPMSCGNKPGSNKVRHPKKQPGDRYTRDSYRRAIHNAVNAINRERRKAAEEAGEEPTLLPLWSPNRLRHSAATKIRAVYGLEAVQSVLGHASMNTSEIYAEKSADLAKTVALRIG
ncbi:MAG: tyrosine-type recombinase/integrase [Thermoguttaceae bacterium]|jgi:integrase